MRAIKLPAAPAACLVWLSAAPVAQEAASQTANQPERLPRRQMPAAPAPR